MVHTKYIYTRIPQCLSSRWDPPIPFPPPLPEPKGEGTHSPAGEGVVGSQFGRLEKKPSTLSTLWVYIPYILLLASISAVQ